MSSGVAAEGGDDDDGRWTAGSWDTTVAFGADRDGAFATGNPCRSHGRDHDRDDDHLHEHEHERDHDHDEHEHDQADRAVPVAEIVVPVDLALWHKVSLNRIYADEGHHNYLSLSLLSGASHRLTGLQVSVGVAGVEDQGAGVQLAGVVAGAGERFRGAQIGGLVAGAGKDAGGLQVGGLVAGSGEGFVGIQAGGLVAGAGRELEGIQLAGLVAGAGHSVRGGQVGGLVAGAGRELEGVQVAGLLAGAGDDVTGLQFGGLGAGAGGTVLGIQLGGLAAGAEAVEGIQAGGLAVGAGRLRGLQVAGVFSATGGGRGLQVAGVANFADEDLAGVQLSLVNIGGDIDGLQLGLVNIADRVRGAQVGLVNIAEHVDGAPLGLVSYVEDGPKDVELWTSTVMPFALGARLGSHRVYSMGVVGLRPAADDDDVLTLGLGLGYHADVAADLGVELDALAHYVTFGFEFADRDAWWGQTRLKVVYSASDLLHLFAGISVNAAVSADDPDGLLTKGPDLEVRSGGRDVRLWPGAFVGIRL